MKTAISLPDALFRQVNRRARSERTSRSALIQRALEVYLATRRPDATAEIDAALDDIGRDGENATWVRAATTHALRRRG